MKISIMPNCLESTCLSFADIVIYHHFWASWWKTLKFFILLFPGCLWDWATSIVQQSCVFFSEVLCHIITHFLLGYWFKRFVEMYYILQLLALCVLTMLPACFFFYWMSMPAIDIKKSPRGSFWNIKFNFEGLEFMGKQYLLTITLMIIA